MERVIVTLDTLLNFRRELNKEIFLTDCPTDKRMVELFVQAEPGIVMCAIENKKNKAVKAVAKYCNKPLTCYDKRITTHDFTDPNVWDSTDNSIFTIAPDPGMKLVITSIQIRFPKSIELKVDNKLYFKVFKNMGAGAIPVINLEYGSVLELVKKTNNPLVIPVDTVEDLASEKVVEMEFKYANPSTLQGTPIVLRQPLGEYIEMGLSGNQQLKRKDQSAYGSDNECWAVINSKQLIDF